MSLQNKIHRIAGWLGLGAAALGGVVLAGWWLGTDPLAGFRLETAPIRANTAACQVLIGVNLWLIARRNGRTAVIVGAAAALGLCLLTLLEHGFGWDLGIDQLLAKDGSSRDRFPFPGRMSVGSCLGFGLIAVAQLAEVQALGKSGRKFAALPATLVLGGAFTLTLLQALAATAGEPGLQSVRIVSHSVVSLVAISAGMLMVRSKGRFLGNLIAATPTGTIARRLFTGIAVVPGLLGLMLFVLVRARVIGLVDGVGLFTAAFLGSGVFIAFRSLDAATAIDESRERSEAARLHLTAQLQEQAAQLQMTVALRTRELEEVNANLRAAAASNARLALVANHATNGVVICDPEGRVEWVNAAFERMTGFSNAEQKGQKPGTLLQGADTDPTTVQKLRTAVHRGESCNVEILNYSKAGRAYWVIIDIQPVRDVDGRLINFIAVETDITEQRQAQARLEAAHHRVTLACTAAELGVWEGDFVNDRCSWDDRMLEIYGLTRETFHGNYGDWAARLHPEDAEWAQRSLERIQAGNESFDRTFRIIRANDGAVRRIQSRAVARRDARGKLLGCTGAERDVTVEHEASQRLRELNDRLQLALDSSGFGVWETDLTTGRMTWDDNMLRIYGCTREQFTGLRSDWTARLHPEDYKDAAENAMPQAADEVAHTNYFRIIRPDGTLRHIESHTLRKRNAEGRVVRLFGLNRDITRDREANQRLVELNERLQLALRSSQFGVWETDLLTGKMDWDERMLEIYGLNRASFNGQRDTWATCLHPDDRAAALLRSDRAINGDDASYDTEFRIVRPDGSVRHIEAHGQLQRDAQGRPLRLVGLNRDISLERKTEAALHLVEERWQLALESNNDGVWDWDLVAGNFYYDTRYSAMLGYALGELPANYAAHTRLIHPDDRADFDAQNDAHLEGRLPFFQHEHRMLAKNGGWVWVLDRAKVVSRDPDGRPLRMVGTHTDITARKQLETRLRQAEELSTQVGQLAQIGGWELELATGQFTFTEGARRIHELPEGQQPDLEQARKFFPPEARDTLRAAMYSRTLEDPSFDFELPFVTARGRSLWVRVIGRAEFRDGRSVAVHGAVQDITARHESENARRELEGQLFQAQKMETLGTLAGGIAHDFNNLLTGIIGYHELATDTIPEDHPARACLNEARGASMRARDLVEQILTFSRQSAGEEHEAVDLTLVLKEASRFLRATLAANILIEADIPENAGRVLANTTQIYQVLLNLGSNAAHAMRPNGGALRISLHPVELGPERAASLSGAAPGSYLRLTVSDTGHGMDEATLRRIFDPFFTTKNTREGTGLGLAVVHGIVRAHRGAIDVESTLGAGTTFHIFLPIAEQAPLPNTGDQVSTPAGRGQSICVVDDEELVGRFIKIALEGIGYNVRAYPSAEACLEDLNNSGAPCDLLLTDQTMPGLQGTELAAALQAQKPELPVIIMSGYFSKVPTQSLGELRYAQLLAKPFTTDELAQALDRAWHLVAAKPDNTDGVPL